MASFWSMIRHWLARTVHVPCQLLIFLRSIAHINPVRRGRFTLVPLCLYLYPLAPKMSRKAYFFQPARDSWFAYMRPISPIPISPIAGCSSVGASGATSTLIPLIFPVIFYFHWVGQVVKEHEVKTSASQSLPWYPCSASTSDSEPPPIVHDSPS